MTDDDRLADLETRVAALEAAVGTAPAEQPPTAGGTVGYTGTVSLDGDVGWRIDYSAGAVAAMPPERLATVLAALGHPARLALVQDLLLGPRTAAELMERADGGSKGQLYHHLGTLTGAGVVDKGARGQYAVAPQRVVPILVAMLASADIGGLLR
ncbi:MULTISPECIES: ArsR/SmtB family transcription factor [Tsukamurella]|uniref:Winged helix-turn-helix transcriptional regulator n=2 Tax=Tsukamurella TaxID=2060 RepID=A0A5C5S5C8_9ACTN|nr:MULTISPECIES: helix-turn-helix domain-containing protein [Tsukamurella]NMD55386.1 winged helix-turn-helix transcriptional regulator [Tsukamurella columbiensis]TWS30657.1 winged helix-turn-helix transcriptional regulator [Tsukamurella conjunctivitidis]